MKKFDIWLPLSFGNSFTINCGLRVLEGINDINYRSDKILINGIHRVGCSYRVQFESDDEMAEIVKEFVLDKLDFKTTMEETRGFSAS